MVNESNMTYTSLVQEEAYKQEKNPRGHSRSLDALGSVQIKLVKIELGLVDVLDTQHQLEQFVEEVDGK